MKKIIGLAALVAACYSPTAFSAFVVVDGNQNKSPALSAMIAPATTKDTSFDVIFYPGKPTLGPKGSRQVKAQMNELSLADNITIVSYQNKDSKQVQRQRSAAISAVLIAEGIHPSKIDYSEESAKPAGYPDDTLLIVMTSKKETARTQPTPSMYIEQKPAILPPPKVAFEETETFKLAQAKRIIALTKNKIIKPDDAINIIEALLNGTGNTVRNSEEQIAKAITVDLPRTWVIDSKKTLQQNLDAWTAEAKWSTPVWVQIAPLSVAYDSTLNGTFLDVIKQISDVLPQFNFEANTVQRTVKITQGAK